MLLELLTGEPLYTGVGDPELAAREGDVQHWILTITQIHPELTEALTTILSVRPQDRFTHSHELLKVLLAAGRKIGGTVNRRSLLRTVIANRRPPQEPATTHEPDVADEFSEPSLDDVSFGSFSDLDPPSTQGLEDLATLSPAASITPQARVPSLLQAPEKAPPPAPDPVPILLPSEFAGMALGGLMILLGITYVFWVL